MNFRIRTAVLVATGRHSANAAAPAETSRAMSRRGIAVWRPSTGRWYINRANGAYDTTLGESGDIPIPGDYVGEGKVRPSVWRPSTGEWFFAQAPFLLPAGPVTVGGPDDIPLAGSLGGTGIFEVASGCRREDSCWRTASPERLVKRTNGAAAKKMIGAWT
jgi:hypothetical protein